MDGGLEARIQEAGEFTNIQIDPFRFPSALSWHPTSHSIATCNSGLHLLPHSGRYEDVMGGESAASPAVSLDYEFSGRVAGWQSLSSLIHIFLASRKEKCLPA